MTLAHPGLHRPRLTRRPLTPRQRLSRADVRYSPYAYVAPFFLLFGLTGLFPLVYTLNVSLHEWDLLGGPGRVRRTGQLRRRADRPAVLELDAQHREHLPAVLGAAGDRRPGAGRAARPEPAGPHVLADERAAAVRGHPGGGLVDLLLDVRRDLRLDQQRAGQPGHRPGAVEDRPAGQPPGHLLDDQLALDGLQRADPAGRHAGGAPRSLRVGGDRRRLAGAPVLLDHHPEHPTRR